MDAPAVLEALRRAGLVISLTPELGLLVRPASALTRELRDLVRRYRNELIDALRVDPDRWCWPYSDAMNSAEIEAFGQCVAQRTGAGLSLDDAEAQAGAMVMADRQALHPP